MNLLSDIITYVRRIIKYPSDAEISDNLIIDYINRFYIMDVDARIQLFDLKTKYAFQTRPGFDRYNMPLYNIQTQPDDSDINFYPVYQGFMSPCYVNGVEVPLFTDRVEFFRYWPQLTQYSFDLATGDGMETNFDLKIPLLPSSVSNNPPYPFILRGHVDMSGIIANETNESFIETINFINKIPVTSVDSAVTIVTEDSNNCSMVVTDSGQILGLNCNYGLLMSPGNAPLGNSGLGGGYSTTLNTVNYQTGDINVTFPSAPGDGKNISVQCYFFQAGLPRAILFHNNTITLRSPPDKQYRVELDAYLSPAAFLNTTNGIPFAYMSEYIARGAARKILSDIGDVEQFSFYEPLFREQELLVKKRSDRQQTATRKPTIYSGGRFNNYAGNSWSNI